MPTKEPLADHHWTIPRGGGTRVAGQWPMRRPASHVRDAAVRRGCGRRCGCDCAESGLTMARVFNARRTVARMPTDERPILIGVELWRDSGPVHRIFLLPLLLLILSISVETGWTLAGSRKFTRILLDKVVILLADVPPCGVVPFYSSTQARVL